MPRGRGKPIFFIPFGILTVVLFVLGVWVFLHGVDWLFAFLFSRPDSADERHRTSTRDRAELALWRYRPAPEDHQQPVLLVHGLASNHRNLAFDERFGVAQYLAERGYDCWALDLRGRSSSPPSSWGFDEYAKHDVATAVEYVLERTGHEQLHWVGHSMGGMLYYAYAGAMGGTGSIASAVTLGSPIAFSRPSGFRWAGQMVQWIPWPFQIWARGILFGWTWFLLRLWPWRIVFGLLVLPGTFLHRPYSFLSFLYTAIVSRPYRGVLFQFWSWIISGRWEDREGRTNYRRRMQDIESPTRVIAGGDDPLCPDPETAGMSFLGSPEKQFLLASRDQGFEEDYGHLGLVFGIHARDEIFPRILEWVEQHPIGSRPVRDEEEGS